MAAVYYIQKKDTKNKAKKASSNQQKNKKNLRHENSNQGVSSARKIDVDLEERRFVFDMKPCVADQFEVGTADSIAVDLKEYLVDFFGSQEKIDFHVVRVVHNKCLDCPGLVADLRVTSSSGNLSRGCVFLYALSENVADILQVLLLTEIATFQLGAIREEYLEQVENFLCNNPFLRKLCIRRPFFKYGRPLKMIRNILKSSTTLSTLEFNYMYLSLSEEKQQRHHCLGACFCHINESRSLERLELRIMGFAPSIMDGLVEGISEASPKLKVLDMRLERCRSSADISRIAKALRKNTTLEEWYTSGRTLANFESIIQCAKLIKHNQCLKKLDLHSFSGAERCLIHPDTWTYVGQALAGNSTLLYLDISYHRISKSSWKALAEGLRVNTSLLTLKANRPHKATFETSDLVLPVLEALRENKTLETLELSYHDLSKSFESLKVLESVLVESRSLKSLEWMHSGLTDEGAEILFRSLPKMKTIEKLHLGHHKCTLEAARAFAEGMKTNYSLVSVSFGGKYTGSMMSGYVRPAMLAEGFEKEFHEIEYYARMNRKGRRLIGSETPVNPSLWPLVLEKALKVEALTGPFVSWDVRRLDFFVGDGETGNGLYDTSMDAVYFLLRDLFPWQASLAELTVVS